MQCECYVSVSCWDDHNNHHAVGLETIDEMLQNSRQHIENTLRTTEELVEQHAKIIQELTSETKRTSR